MSDYQTRNTDSGLGDTGTTGMNTGSGTSGMSESGTHHGGTTQRMQEMASQARERMTEKMSQMSDSMSRMSQEMSEKMRGSMDRMRHVDTGELNEMYDDVLESARRNPGRTILVSAAVGMVLGMFLRGNHR